MYLILSDLVLSCLILSYLKEAKVQFENALITGKETHAPPAQIASIMFHLAQVRVRVRVRIRVRVRVRVRVSVGIRELGVVRDRIRVRARVENQG